MSAWDVLRAMPGATQYTADRQCTIAIPIGNYAWDKMGKDPILVDCQYRSVSAGGDWDFQWGPYIRNGLSLWPNTQDDRNAAIQKFGALIAWLRWNEEHPQ